MVTGFNKKGVYMVLGVIFLVLSIFFLIVYLRETEKEKGPYLVVDYSKTAGIIKLDYGLNEAADWMNFVNRLESHIFHRESGSKFIRVWVDDPSYRKNSTIPYENGVYNFEKLDSFVNAAIDSDAVPLVVFAQSPSEMTLLMGSEPTERKPSDDYAFAVYCAEIVKHYKEMCENNKLVKKCNIDDWYWEVWNEPYWNYWWENATYIKMYNQVYREIKNVAPNTKVGGYTLKFVSDRDKLITKWFLENTEYDFISIHVYGNYPIIGAKDQIYIKNLDNLYLKGLYEQEMINYNELLFYKDIKSLKEYVNKYSSNKDTEIIISELGPNWNWEYEPYLDEPFVSAWYASALSWMIKSNTIDKEFYYSGTINVKEGSFAMWSFVDSNDEILMYPVYYMKKDFVKYNTKGSRIYETRSNDNSIEILAVSNEDGQFITLINKNNKKVKDVNVAIQNLDYQKIIDLKYNKEISEIKFNLDPYEVRFIKLV
jgi:hypothetical protein